MVRWFILLLACMFLAGCESSDPKNKPLTFREQQDRALSDPMNYKPDFSRDRITSGGITDFDKDGFNKDMNSVLNP